jgi:hypothetical protein
VGAMRPGERGVVRWLAVGVFALMAVAPSLCAQEPRLRGSTSRQALALKAFGNDAPWYLENIPFLEIDDAAIQETYYYRWKLYRSHLREIGEQGTVVTEFLPSVPWARHPYEDLNDSSSFHILEGRWLRNPAYVALLVDHLYAGGGNDRHFSESIAAATFAWIQVTGDPAPAVRHLDAMQHVYNLWDDHFDAERNLYWVEPLLDATEYTISSIDASGAGFAETSNPKDDGFTGGYAFRPSINAYQFGNAMAIAELARLGGQPEVTAVYARRAEALRTATLGQLWNPALGHFTDVYQRSTKTVTKGEFVRGRELVGFVPWQFELPGREERAGAPAYGSAWQHLLSASELGGAYGLRTVEPSYPRYLVQYRYDAATGLRECQWNGPSWPFQTSQTLSGMANLLRDYRHDGVTATDYVHLLRQYTRQHRIGGDRLDLEEDYNPDVGGPIVGLPRSHHYIHSTYNDLVMTGLLGIRPRTDEAFEMDPLLPAARGPEQPIRYFLLRGLRYHGHELTVVYDVDGSRYGAGAGLSVFSDGRPLLVGGALKRTVLPLKTRLLPSARVPVDLAVNVWAREPSAFEGDLPVASVSSVAPDASVYEPIDGRLWFFPEIAHGWSPAVADALQPDWYGVDLRHPVQVGSVELAFFADGAGFAAPQKVVVQVRVGGVWRAAGSTTPVANGMTRLVFGALKAQEIRVVMEKKAAGDRIRLIAFRVFGPGA